MEPQNTLLKERYLIVKLLGRGGMGEVFLAEDKLLSRRVAVKKVVYGDNEFLLKAAEKEAMVLARLQHQCLPKVLDYFNEDHAQYIVMEYIGGKDLGELLQAKQSAFSVDEVMGWGNTLLDTLTYLHSQNPPVVHRDIKPQNIKITDEGKLFLLDFGLVKDTPTRVRSDSLSLSVYGFSQSYAPLEQINGDPTSVQTDVYELSATLYHLLTNVKPADALDRATKKIEHKPDPLRPAHDVNPSVPPALSQVLQAGLQLSCDDRVPSVQALRESLAKAQPKHSRMTVEIHDDQTSSGAGSKPAAAASKPKFMADKRKRRFMIGAAIISPLLIAGIVFAAIAILTNPDYERLQGVWESTASNNAKFAIIVEGGSVDLGPLFDSKRFEFTLDSSTTPKQFTIKGFGNDKEDLRGIFELSDRRIKVAIANGKNDPLHTEFTEKDTWLFEYKGKSSNFAPVDPNYLNGIATWNYLVQVHQISKATEASLPQFDKIAGFDQFITAVNTGLASIAKMREDLNQLPVLGVDSELTSYVARLTQSVNQMENLFKDLNVLARDMKNFVDKSNSQEVASGRFWDWLAGSQSTNEQLEREKQELQNRLVALQNRLTPSQEEVSRLMAQQLELRSSLSKKYNREFPKF